MLYAPRHYLYLDAVARSGSIRQAARELHVASTALNRKILELEEEIGMPLFERLPRGVRLTAAGEVLLAAVRRSLAELESASSQIEQLQGLVRGTVRLACAESVANDVLPETIARYQSRHPGVRFHLTVGGTSTLMQALLQDEVELVVAHDPPASRQVRALASIAQPLLALMRPDHPLAARASLRLADCQRYPLAMGAGTFGSRRLIDDLAERAKLSLQIVFEANTVEALKSFALAANVICFQFEAGTLRETRRGELVALPLRDRELASGRLVMAARQGRTLPVAASTFAQFLQEALAAR